MHHVPSDRPDGKGNRTQPPLDFALGAGGRWALGAGLALQLTLLASAQMFPRALVGDEVGYWARGTALASGWTSPPDFVSPPLYTWLIAGFVGLFGNSRLPLEIFQAALFLGCGLLLRVLLLAVPFPPGPVNLATALFVLDLEAAGYTVLFWPEVLFLFLLLAGTALVFLPPEPRAGLLLAGGVCFGAAVLTKLVLAPCLPVLLVAAGLSNARLLPRTRILRVVLLAAGMAAPTVPVVAWNGLVHRYYGIAQSGPFNLWVGLNDPATKLDYDAVPAQEMGRYLASGSDPGARDRSLWMKIAAKVEAEPVGTILSGQLRKQYFRLFDKESYFTDLLDGGRLSGARRSSGACGQVVRTWSYLVYAAILALAALGAAFVTWRELRGPLALPALFLQYNLSLYLLLHVKTRYRVAFLPATMAFAAVALGRFASRERWPAPARIVSGGLLAALALFLAFRRI